MEQSDINNLVAAARYHGAINPEDVVSRAMLELLERGKNLDDVRPVLYLRVVSRARSERSRDGRQRHLAREHWVQVEQFADPSACFSETLGLLAESLSPRELETLTMALQGFSGAEMVAATGHCQTTIQRSKRAMRKAAVAGGYHAGA